MFDATTIIGNTMNMSEYLELVVDRTSVPAQIKLYAELADEKVMQRLKRSLAEKEQPEKCMDVTLIQATEVQLNCSVGEKEVITLPSKTRLKIMGSEVNNKHVLNFTLTRFKDREVIRVGSKGRTCIPVLRNPGNLVPVIIRGRS